MRISDWSSDVCSSDLRQRHDPAAQPHHGRAAPRQGPRGDADADGRLGHLTASVADISPAQHLDRAGRPRLAYRHVAGAGPTVVLLPGYMSDMGGGKATALFAWAAPEGRAWLPPIFSARGQSPGLLSPPAFA